MNETLRPSTLGDILDHTVQLYRSNFWLFAGTAALPLVLALVLLIPALAIFAIPGFASGTVDLSTIAGVIALLLILLLALPLSLAAFTFSIAGLTHAAVSVHRGQKPTIRAALKSVRPRFWTYLWCLLLQWILAVLIPIGVAEAFVVPLIYWISHAGGQLASGLALGFLVFLVVAAAIGVTIWLVLGYAMGMAVCVVEQKSAWQSLKRSWHLSRGTRGRIFVLYLLSAALSMVVMTLSYFLAATIFVIATLLGNNSTAAAIAIIASAIVYIAGVLCAQIAIVPVSWIALVLFYYDQRIRKEGYDIEWMMQQAGLTQPSFAPPPNGGTAAFGPATPPDTVGEP